MFALETDRLRLREMNFSDVPHLMEIFSDPIAMRYYVSTKTVEEAEKWVRWNLTNYNSIGAGLWICELKDSGRFVGQCGIVPQVVDDKVEMEIGYLFSRAFWGQGLATEAANRAKEFGFEQMHVKRLISMIYIPNTPSIRVAERIGMSFEKETMIKNRETFIYSINI